jgi:hypothetical protein
LTWKIGIGKRCESDEVVDDNVDRAAHAEPVDSVEIQGLGSDPLSRQRGVPVDQEGQDAPPALRADSVLPCFRPAHHHRANGFEMARVRHEMKSDPLSRRRDMFARGPQVVTHVSTTQHAARNIVLEVGKEVSRRTADDVDHDVEPTAVAHPDQAASGTALAADIKDCVEQGNDRGASLQGVAFGAHIPLVDKTLE